MKTSMIRIATVVVFLAANFFTPEIAHADEAQDMETINEFSEWLNYGTENAINCQKELQESKQPGEACLFLQVSINQLNHRMKPVQIIDQRPLQEISQKVQSSFLALRTDIIRYTTEVDKATALFDIALEARDAAQAELQSSGKIK